jgi:hypothetical protein
MEREITGSERAVWKRGIISLNLVCAAHLHPGCLREDDLPHALACLQRHHPLLGVHLEQREGRDLFVRKRTGDIPVRVIHGAEATRWRNELVRELQTPFAGTGHVPLVRLLVVHSPVETTLIMTVHHCIGDGISLVLAIRDLLAFLGGCGDEVDASGVKNCFPRIFSPDMPAPRPLGAALRVANGLLGFLPPPSDTLRIEMENNRAVCWQLDQETTRAFLRACRENRVTVHAALVTLFLAAQSDIQGGRGAATKRVYSPVSIRRELRPNPGECFGLFATDSSLSRSYHHHIPFWENVRAVQIDLRRSTNLGKILFPLHVVNTLSPHLVDRLVVAMYRRKRLRFGWCLSNLGLLDIPVRYGPIHLYGISPPIFYVQRAEKTVSILTMDNRMFFSLIHRPQRISVDTVDAIQERAMQLLRKKAP